MTHTSSDTSSAPPSRWRGTFEPLQHAAFRNTWAASLGASIGAAIQVTGVGWMMTTLTSDPLPVALVQTSAALPVMLFSLYAGAIADNFRRRTVMMIANSAALICTTILLVYTLLGLMTPWLLLTLNFFVACGTALNTPSWQASVGDLIPRKRLPGAVTLVNSNHYLSLSLGPALGGSLITALGIASTFTCNALSYLGLLSVLYRWPKNIQPKESLPRERIGRSIAVGMRYTLMAPNLKPLLFRGFVFGLIAIAVIAVLPLVAKDQLHGGPRTFGLLLGGFGVGGLLGALLNRRISGVMKNESALRLGFFLAALCSFILAWSTDLWLSCFARMLGGFAWLIVLSRLNSIVQLSSARWVVGRTMAIYQMTVACGYTIGSWLWGRIAEAYGVPAVLYASAFALIAAIALGRWWPLPEALDNDLAPSGEWREPQLKLEIAHNDGPVEIEIEYIIREKDIPEFLERIEARRIARLRDGVHNWTIQRDLHQPEIWRTRYQLPTWLEYICHNARVTKHDTKYGNDLLAFHQGSAPPKVRRTIISRHPNAFRKRYTKLPPANVNALS